MILIITSIIYVFPIYWMAISSLKKEEELYSVTPTFFPHSLSIEYYIRIFRDMEIGRFIFNSVFNSLLATFLVIIISSLAGYALARFSFRLKGVISRFILFIYVFPPILMTIPLYVMYAKIGLINTYIGLVFAYVANNCPLVTWTLKAYFTTIPIDLEEAAMVDGCSRISALARITVPVSLPGITAGAILAFIGCWTDFIFALTFISSRELFTLSVAVADLAAREYISWGEVMASSIIMVMPALIFSLYAQKYLIRGLASGAVKY
jgi:ABC-type glycerol-3-phosphate transport system permease component